MLIPIPFTVTNQICVMIRLCLHVPAYMAEERTEKVHVTYLRRILENQQLVPTRYVGCLSDRSFYVFKGYR